MHEFTQSADGWRAEHIRDDGKVNASDKSRGCSFLEEVRRNQKYSASIRYGEHLRDEQITVEGIVYRCNGKEHHTLEDALFLEKTEFKGSSEGKPCRARAAGYAAELKRRITADYFPESCP